MAAYRALGPPVESTRRCISASTSLWPIRAQAGPSRPLRTACAPVHRPLVTRADGSKRFQLQLSCNARFRSPSRRLQSTCLTAEEKLARSRIAPLLDDLPGPVDWAVAYGSGVRHQANADPAGPPPMTDLLLAVPCTTAFHRANMRRNPRHYPLTARLLGADVVGRLTEVWGAGVWYVTMVKIRHLEVKYGIISIERLERDLERWETLYVAGRLHKPTLPLVSPSPALNSALSANHRSALALTLLLSPSRIPEMALWERLAGLSYAGDPRMRVPGAENPDKVRNIVRGQGALEGLRGMYGRYMPQLGLRWVGEEVGKGDKAGSVEWAWRGNGEAVLEQPAHTAYTVALLSQLPANLQYRVAARYAADHGTIYTSENTASRAAPERGRAFWEAILAGKAKLARPLPAPAPAPAPTSSPASTAVGPTKPDAPTTSQRLVELQAVLLDELGNIIRRPALTQTFKGLFTAGLRKSFAYAMAKFGKWLAARRK